MDREINKFIEDTLGIKIIEEYEFKKIYGLTFVFKRAISTINERISSAEIRPVGIIYEENGQYYLAPLDVIDEISEVIKEFVEKEII